LKHNGVVIKKGEWVKVTGLYNWIGFITSISHTFKEYEVFVVRRINGGEINKRVLVDFEDTEKLDSRPSEDDLYRMIDIALDTKDREWFLELQNMLPKSEGVSL